MTLSDAEAYFNYGCKEGYFDPDDFKELSQEEFIKKMEDIMNKADVYADNIRKGEA